MTGKSQAAWRGAFFVTLLCLGKHCSCTCLQAPIELPVW